jgi:hypothetical protein
LEIREHGRSIGILWGWRAAEEMGLVLKVNLMEFFHNHG